MSEVAGGGRTLTHAEAKRFYDRLGARQDSQAFYEDRVLDRLRSHLELGNARAVVELGCGTGRFAARLLSEDFGPQARYLALDSSDTMVDLARRRLEAFGARAEVRRTDGSPLLPVPDGSSDRFVSTYVLDLLSLEDIRIVLDEAHRVLVPGGLLGVAGLARGESGAAWLCSRLWGAVHRLHPALVGGCRPLALGELLPEHGWKVRYDRVVSTWAIPSEVLVAERR